MVAHEVCLIQEASLHYKTSSWRADVNSHLGCKVCWIGRFFLPGGSLSRGARHAVNMRGLRHLPALPGLIISPIITKVRHTCGVSP